MVLHTVMICNRTTVPQAWCLPLILDLGLSFLLTWVNGVYVGFAFSFKMAKICSNGLGVPILFPVGKDGLTTIMALHISIRFGLQDTSVWVEREVYDRLTLTFLHTMPKASKLFNDGTVIWTLKPGRYKVYGLTTSQMSNPIQFVIPHQTSTCTITPPIVRVKIE